ncbi:ribosome biogenesis protein SLX9 homolog [Episyrphus balteatus]|uniref:ribosome biogenesis protein SLX9 homolog n=1 Tax=Episyrphus balteatus TaxID=286459 RepID=UPI0024865DCE|nr:ribosome biogenesis protein SLX9 homolog [Episyrphus balteatus]
MGKVNKTRALKQKLSKRIDATKKAVTSIASKVSFKAKDKSSDTNLLLSQTPSGLTPKKHKNKKEKFRLKHKNLLTKFAQQKKQKKEEIAKKNREKTAVVGDMKKLKDALPSLDELFKLSRENIKTGVPIEEPQVPKKLNTKDKIKKKNKQLVNRVSSLQALLKDPDFKKNPREAIAYHIKYTNGLIE